jgi:hypothetical protein
LIENEYTSTDDEVDGILQNGGEYLPVENVKTYHGMRVILNREHASR